MSWAKVRQFFRDWMASSKVTAAGLASLLAVLVFDYLEKIGYTFDMTTVSLVTGLFATGIAYITGENRPAPSTAQTTITFTPDNVVPLHRVEVE